MEEPPTEYSSSKLYVWGENFDPVRVTDILKMEPHETWRKGERAVVIDAQGQSKSLNRVHKRSGWCRVIDQEMRSLNIEAQLRFWCDLLGGREAAIRTLQASGCDFVIDCFVCEGPVVYIKLARDLMKSMSNLGIELTFGIYDSTSAEFQTDEKS